MTRSDSSEGMYWDCQLLPEPTWLVGVGRFKGMLSSSLRTKEGDSVQADKTNAHSNVQVWHWARA